MSILARKYNLKDPNPTGDLVLDNTNIKKHPVGTIIPETIGSDRNLFENNQTLTNTKENSINCFQTKYGGGEKANTDPSLNCNVNIDSSLNQEGQEQKPALTNIERIQPTLSQKQVLSRENLQIHAPSLQYVPDRKQ